MKRRGKLRLLLAFATAWTALAAGASGASSRTTLGAVISNPELVALAGGKQAPQGKDVTNVLVFFRPDKDYSNATMKGLAPCEQRTVGKPVRWVALVSDRYKPEEVSPIVKESGIAMPVLFDAGDVLYNELAVAQLPAVAITDKEHKLVAFQPFTKLNFCELVEARVRHALKEISDSQLEAVVNPASTKVGGEASVSRRHVRMAEAFLKSGNAERALESARAAVQEGPDLAAAHSVLGAALQASGKCKDAVAEFDKALALDKADSRALDGRKACEGK